MEKVGIALKEYFKTKKLTQRQVAEIFGVPQPYISRMISGKDNFGKNNAKLWADTFGFSYTFLLTGEGSLFDNDESLVMSNVEEDVASGADVDDFKYWKEKYEEAEKEIIRLRGSLEAYENMFRSMGISVAPPAVEKSAM